MRTITRNNGTRITKNEPGCRGFAEKGRKRYRDLLAFIENDPKLKLLHVKRSKP